MIQNKRKICSHCGFPIPVVYKYFLDDLDVSVLLKIWKQVVESGINRVDVRQINLNYGERSRLTQLRFHALIAKAKNEKDGHIPANWLITKRGADFLHGRIEVPAYVITQNNRVIAKADNCVAKQDFKNLKCFQASYEIVDNRLIKLKMEQMSLI